MVQSQRCNPRPKPGPPQGPLGAPGTPRLRKLCCSLPLSLKMTQRVPWLMLFSHVASCRVDSGRQVHRCGQGQFWRPCSSHSPPEIRWPLRPPAAKSPHSPTPSLVGDSPSARTGLLVPGAPCSGLAQARCDHLRGGSRCLLACCPSLSLDIASPSSFLHSFTAKVPDNSLRFCLSQAGPV